ncbi:hypothetical protein GDO78_017242 [Eleutherodactylus coqui]|uniref:Uncharacterized protein n=1 Tax=Eleutherodactylus coqui TaxID=57060 RepID=A0A8J6JW10_ELECQ|nr:hypothetical protein GDO78_017242 [Eleutherodactylus coqui]
MRGPCRRAGGWGRGEDSISELSLLLTQNFTFRVYITSLLPRTGLQTALTCSVRQQRFGAPARVNTGKRSRTKHRVSSKKLVLSSQHEGDLKFTDKARDHVTGMCPGGRLIDTRSIAGDRGQEGSAGRLEFNMHYPWFQ